MKGPKRLLESEDHWETAIGKAFLGERVVFRGKTLFQELKNISWMGLYLYGITGKIYSDKQLRLFEAIWTLCVSYPDPRIWNNRVAALAGTTRSTSPLAISAASAVSEATIYGHGPCIGAIDFLFTTKKALDGGANLGDLVRKELKIRRNITGFGRPVIRGAQDERIEPLMIIVRTLYLDDGPYLKLLFAVDKILKSRRLRLQMNIGGLAAALAADQGLSGDEFVAFLVPAYVGGMMPCYLDALNHPEGTLFPLRCSRIDYQGPEQRPWK